MKHSSKLGIQKMIFEGKMNPTILFYDHMNQIADRFANEYPHWETDRSSIRLFNREEKSLFILEHNRLWFTIDKECPKEFFLNKVLDGVAHYRKSLSLDSFTRVGVRFLTVHEVPFRFHELAQLLQERLYHHPDILSAILVPEFTDLAYIAEFEKERCQFRLALGPVNKDEARRRIVPPAVQGEDPPELPEVGIFLDIDCYALDISVSELDKLLEKFVEYNIVISRELLRYLLEER